jgi:lipopolysaccharide/colanic/teichoic acid biosynthesis glycosyltransferase
MKPLNRGKSARIPNLLEIVKRGALVRRHRHFSDWRSISLVVLAVAIVQCCVYVLVMMLAGRGDWWNIARTCAGLALVPVAAGFLLVTMRQNQLPATSGAIAASVVFVFVVAVLSALRIPVSYTGFAWTFPIALVGMAYANLRLQRMKRGRVALLDYPGVDEARQVLGPAVPVITPDSPDAFDYDCVLIDPEAHHNPEWAQVMARFYMLGIEIAAWPKYAEGYLGRVAIEDFDLAHVAYTPTQIYYSKIKRAIDVGAVLVLAPIAVVVGALIWVYIRLIDGGPVFFVQLRRGYGGSVFRLYKFRTMRKGTGEAATQTDDARILPGCRLLRQLRLDELPQLINIARGDMSWIGPRPVSLDIARKLERSVPQYINRQLVLPGLTGWAQVSHGYASNLDEERMKLEYDLYYVKNISFDLDLLILFKTVTTIMLRYKSK